jgi:hypothetical protein
MAMRKSSRQELRKARELLRSVFEDYHCIFCRQLLIPKGRVAIGECDGAPIETKITIHHANGNHDDDRKGNRRYTHTRCHKRFHMKKQWRDGTLG